MIDDVSIESIEKVLCNLSIELVWNMEKAHILISLNNVEKGHESQIIKSVI